VRIFEILFLADNDSEEAVRTGFNDRTIRYSNRLGVEQFA
jgi:hypothetical protein